MGLLDDIMADDAAYLVNTDEFGETVAYAKYGVSGTREIKAVVMRDPPESIPDVPARNMTPNLVVEVRNDSTYGISSDEIDVKVDQILLSERIGEAATAFNITRILSQDHGTMRLQLR